MIRRTAVFAVALWALSAAGQANAAFMGTLGVVDFGTKINTAGLGAATTFTLGGLLTNGNTTGGFTPVSSLTAFGTGSFSLSGTPALVLTGTSIGTYTETAAPILTSVSIVGGVVTGETFYILGTFAPVAALGDGGAVPASFTVSFTQTGGPGTAVSASGTLSIPPTGVVPEPASIALLGLGLAGIGGVSFYRRRLA